MTKKRSEPFEYTRLQFNQYRLRKIAMDLEFCRKLSIPDTEFLIKALRKIGEGGDANEALLVKARKGERRSPSNTAKAANVRFALSFVALLIAPVADGGFGMDLQDAIEETAAKFKNEPNFGYTEATLTHYWDNHPDWRTRQFPRPIETLPDRKDYEAPVVSEPK